MPVLLVCCRCGFGFIGYLGLCDVLNFLIGRVILFMCLVCYVNSNNYLFIGYLDLMLLCLLNLLAVYLFCCLLFVCCITKCVAFVEWYYFGLLVSWLIVLLLCVVGGCVLLDWFGLCYLIVLFRYCVSLWFAVKLELSVCVLFFLFEYWLVLAYCWI